MSHAALITGICMIAVLAICTLGADAASPAKAKARKHISAWYEFKLDKSLDSLDRAADMLASISNYGQVPPRTFIEHCHEKGITVFRLAAGSPAAFDTPAHREETINGYLQLCRDPGFDGIDLDYEWQPLEQRKPYAELITALAKALHREGKQLSICVYTPIYGPPGEGMFYDEAVIAKTCDQVRVMCYDLHHASALDAKWWRVSYGPGFGPTSTAPWGRAAMTYWAQHVPKAKLLMALPAYGNDYVMTPGGKGSQIYAPVPPLPENQPYDRYWLAYEQINVYRYVDAQQRPHLFFASDAQSTKAHLATIDEMNLPGLSFWNFDAVPEEIWQALREWLDTRK